MLNKLLIFGAGIVIGAIALWWLSRRYCLKNIEEWKEFKREHEVKRTNLEMADEKTKLLVDKAMMEYLKKVKKNEMQTLRYKGRDQNRVL